MVLTTFGKLDLRWTSHLQLYVELPSFDMETPFVGYPLPNPCHGWQFTLMFTHSLTLITGIASFDTLDDDLEVSKCCEGNYVVSASRIIEV